MGANCCVAARDKPLPDRLSSEVSNYRNIRHSPSWSFRWDNRTHIEDIMDNPSRFPHHNSGNVRPEGKSAADTETEGLSGGEDPSYSLQTRKWRKKVGTAGNSRSGFADQSSSSNLSPEENYSLKSSSSANYSIAKPTASAPPTPSSSSLFKAPDPSASTIYSLQSNPSSSKKARSSPSNDLAAVGSHGGSSDGWSMQAFSELVAASSQRERWSFDNENPNSRLRSPPQSCRVCSKLLKEKSPWSVQKIVSTHELPVTAVLACGHVYHAECLESVTSEIDRYDPPCPTCTNGEKSIPKMKAKSKISSRATMADIDVDLKRSGKSPSMSATSSMKKPFLKRHFSIGSRSVSDGEAMMKKRGFWERHRRD